MTTSVVSKVSGTEAPSAIIKGASGTAITSTSASSGDGDALATVSFAANELSAGDVIRLKYIYEGIHSSGDINHRGWLGGIASGTRVYTGVLSNGGSDQVMTSTRMIFINTTTEAHITEVDQANGVGNDATICDSITIDTTTAMDLVLGFQMSAGTATLIGYTVEHIKEAL